MSDNEGRSDSKFMTGFLVGFVVGVLVCLGVGLSLGAVIVSRDSTALRQMRMDEMRAREAAERAEMEARRALDRVAAEQEVAKRRDQDNKAREPELLPVPHAEESDGSGK